jgi:hypothetical protein
MSTFELLCSRFAEQVTGRKVKKKEKEQKEIDKRDED